MATTGYDDRTLLVEVSGLRQQEVMPTSHYTFKVPYRSLARTLQFIRCNGGKIVRIHSLSLSLPIQQSVQPSMPLEANTAALLPLADLKGSLPAESVPGASESTQPAVVAVTGELPSPQMVEARVPKSSKLLGLVSFLLGKLKAIGWIQH